MCVYTEKLHAEQDQYCQRQRHERLIPDISLQRHNGLKILHFLHACMSQSIECQQPTLSRGITAKSNWSSALLTQAEICCATCKMPHVNVSVNNYHAETLSCFGLYLIRALAPRWALGIWSSVAPNRCTGKTWVDAAATASLCRKPDQTGRT